MKLIIDIPKEIYKASKIIDVQYEDVIQIPLEVIANGTPIPDNATNGDVIKAMFPNIEKQMIDLVMKCGTSVMSIGDDVWWNSPYQKGDKKYNAE